MASEKQNFFENAVIHPDEVVNNAWVLMRDFQSTPMVRLEPSEHEGPWMAPPTGVLTLNVDGVTFAEYGRAGVGCVLRNEEGDILMAATSLEHLLNTPLEIEFLAMLRGLELCLNMGI